GRSCCLISFLGVSSNQLRNHRQAAGSPSRRSISKHIRAKNSSTSATVSRPSPCHPQKPTAPAPSHGQSATHSRGGGGGGAPRPGAGRAWSLVRLFRRARRPWSLSRGAIPPRHTFRQLSMVVLLLSVPSRS